MCYSLATVVADADREVLSSDAVRTIGNIRVVEEGSFFIVSFFLKHFIIHYRSRVARDRILAASVVLAVGTFLVLRPWTLPQAMVMVLNFKVTIELEGVPAHAWSLDTAAKILAPACWIQCVDLASDGKSDMSAFRLTAWTNDPSAIPKVVNLIIVENEQLLQFSNLPPYLTKKDVLSYRVLMHIWNMVDFDPLNPSPPPPPSDSDDSDSGHDGNLDRHHFTCGSSHRVQGFWYIHDAVDGDDDVHEGNNTGSMSLGEYLSIEPFADLLFEISD